MATGRHNDRSGAECVRPAALDRGTDRQQDNSNEQAQPVDAALPAAALDLAEIADRYTGLLHGIGRRYRLTPDERDDAAQSTWLALCQNAGRIRDPDRIAGWLATTMRRNCTATLRQRRRETPASDTLDTHARSETAPDVVEIVAARQATLSLHQAIARLPDRQRRLIQLQLHPSEPGYAQISRAVPMPVGSIGPVRARALHRLRALLHTSNSAADALPPRRETRSPTARADDS